MPERSFHLPVQQLSWTASGWQTVDCTKLLGKSGRITGAKYRVDASNNGGGACEVDAYVVRSAAAPAAAPADEDVAQSEPGIACGAGSATAAVKVTDYGVGQPYHIDSTGTTMWLAINCTTFGSGTLDMYVTLYGFRDD